MSYSVNQRFKEIAIRVALGAQRSDILKLIMNRVVGLVLIGLLIGIGGAFALTRVLSSLLYGVSATDPFIFVSVSALLMLVAVAACYFPIRRATRIDPIAVLHE
jgi:ABC-type antimicrobial peptide transport system permease subunit